MHTLFILLITFLGTQNVFCQTARQPYLDGRTLAATYQPLVQFEKGFWVSVPLDYNNPMVGNVDIYAHFASDFDKSKPTFAIFTGGPGQTSHFGSTHKLYEFYSRLGFNALLLDQRGIAFSRPKSEQIWKSPSFYSSETVARDFDEVRKFLGIDRWTVYGASYGTVPATIYASLFPQNTVALVLEGIVGGGFDHIPWQSSYISNLVQQYYDCLPNNLRQKIDRSSIVQSSFAQFFPTFVKAYMMAGGYSFLPSLTQKLNAAISTDDSQFWMQIAGDSSSTTQDDLPHDEDVVNNILMIKEFGQGRCDVSDNLILENGKIKKTTTNPQSSYCLQANSEGLPNDTKLRQSTYDPVNYKVEVPIFYLEGSTDSATTPAWGLYHSMVVPQRGFQFFIFDGVGHNVGGRLEDDSNSQIQKDKFKSIFAQMLAGSPILETQVNDFNNNSLYQVTMFSDLGTSQVLFNKYFQGPVPVAFPIIDQTTF